MEPTHRGTRRPRGWRRRGCRSLPRRSCAPRSRRGSGAPRTARRPGPMDDPVDVGHDDVPGPAWRKSLRMAVPAARPRSSRRARPRAACPPPGARCAGPPAPRWPSRAGRRGTPGCRAPPARLDLEAARCGDVLEVDPREHRGDGLTVRMISSTSVVSRQIGKASMSANRLNSRPCPPCGQQRRAADVAEPQHGGAVRDDGDRVPLDRGRRASSGFSAMAAAHPRHPGV